MVTGEQSGTLEAARQRIRAAGLRLTAPRVTALSLLLERRSHHTVAEMESLLSARLGGVSTQGVYDVLAALEGAGLARRIDIPGSPARYESRIADNHHHLVCRSCGEVRDVDCEVGTAPCLDPSDAAGYAVDKAEITFWGLCPTCQARTPDEKESPA